MNAAPARDTEPDSFPNILEDENLTPLDRLAEPHLLRFKISGKVIFSLSLIRCSVL